MARRQTVFERYSPSLVPTEPPIPAAEPPAGGSERPLYRVLSLDGGGIRGLVAIRVLEEIERRTGKPIGESFDLITGTSAGGIIALGLTRPDPKDPTRPAYKASDLAPLFKDKGEDIFGKSWLSPVLNLFRRRYDSRPFKAVLGEFFGESTTSEAVTDILVHSYDTNSHEPVQIRTRKFGRDGLYSDKQWNYRMVDAALATSAAPTYFEPAEVRTMPMPGGSEGRQDQILIDGGIYANNPAVFGLKEAQKLMPPNADIMMVSVGTGSSSPDYTGRDVKRWGPLDWINPFKRVPLLAMTMQAQARGADQVMRTALGDRYIRIDGQLDDPRLGEDAPDPAFDNASAQNLQRLERFAQMVVADHREALQRAATMLETRQYQSRQEFRQTFVAANAPRRAEPMMRPVLQPQAAMPGPMKPAAPDNQPAPRPARLPVA